MADKIHAEHFIHFSFVKLCGSPNIRDRFYFGIISIKSYFDNDVVPVFCGGEMINHCQMRFPVNAGEAKKKIEK